MSKCPLCGAEVDCSCYRQTRLVATSSHCIPVHSSCFEVAREVKGGKLWAERHIRLVAEKNPPGGGEW